MWALAFLHASDPRRRGEATAGEGGSEHGSPKRFPRTRQLSVLRSYMGKSCSLLALTNLTEERETLLQLNAKNPERRALLNGAEKARGSQPMEDLRTSITLIPKWGTRVL